MRKKKWDVRKKLSTFQPHQYANGGKGSRFSSCVDRTQPSVCSTTYTEVQKGVPLWSPCARIEKLILALDLRVQSLPFSVLPSCTLHVRSGDLKKQTKWNTPLPSTQVIDSTKLHDQQNTWDKNFLIYPCFCKQAFARFWPVSSPKSQNKKLNIFLLTTNGADTFGFCLEVLRFETTCTSEIQSTSL